MPGEDEQLFVRAVEAGSLKAAAEEIGAAPSTVSRRVAALEERLGVKLLNRSTRRSTPTEAGARYYEGLRRLLGEQRALEADVSGSADEPTGRLRVTAPVDFGTRFVLAALTDLAERAPALEVELYLTSYMLDLVEKGFDCAVRIGRLADSTLVAKKLGVVPRVLIASQDYLARRGVPETPEDLAGHEFLFYVRQGSEPTYEMEGPSGVETVRPRGRMWVNSVNGLRSLVEGGAGIHLGPRWAYHDDLVAGRLVEVLPQYGLRAYPLQIVYPPTPWVPAKVRAFIDAMVARVAAEPALLAGSPRVGGRRPMV